MSGTLAPIGRVQYFSDTGTPLAGGLLYTYSAGTSTPEATYTTSALSVANANPIVLDSAGRCSIYLSANTSYKFILKTSAGVTVWTQDNIGNVPSAGETAEFNHIQDFRLTLSSATPIPQADVTAATVLYATPYKGNRIALFDGSAWVIYTTAEMSALLGPGNVSASTVFDVFCSYDSLVTQAPVLSMSGWASATARTTGLALQDGVWVKSGDATQRYLGTIRSTSGQFGEDSAQNRLVWNFYHRVPRTLRVLESTDSWTYTTAAFRQANGAATNQVTVVVGVAESSIALQVLAIAGNTNAGVAVKVGIGEDSTTAAAASTTTTYALLGITDIPGANFRVQLISSLNGVPAIGYHTYAWLEFSVATGTTTWYGDAGAPTLAQSGMVGSIDA